MISPKVFPTIMIVTCVLAAVGYAIDDPSNWRKIVYWGGLAVVNFVVTY